jgi:hypothetical protein
MPSVQLATQPCIKRARRNQSLRPAIPDPPRKVSRRGGNSETFGFRWVLNQKEVNRDGLHHEYRLTGLRRDPDGVLAHHGSHLGPFQAR